MPIDYTLITHKGELKKWDRPCWNNYNCAMRYMHTTGLFDSNKDTWRTRLDLGKGTSYWEENSTEARNWSDDCFDRLFGPWFHPDWVIYGYDYKPGRKARTSITYTAACPFWVMVASASIYRMHCDMSNFIHWWNRIDKVQKQMKYKMHPWTQYFLVTNISNIENSSCDFMKDGVFVTGNTNHMPMSSSIANSISIQHISMWNYEKLTFPSMFHKPLVSMLREYRETTTLRYMGRDAFFADYQHENSNWIKIAGSAVGLVKEETTRYSSKTRVHLPSFIEKVLMPNNM